MLAFSQDASAQRARRGGSSQTQKQETPAAPATNPTPAPAPAAAPAASNDDARRQAIRDALAELSAKDNIAEVQLNTEKNPKYLLLPNGKAMMLQITENDIKREVTKIMPIYETNIYPGCIVYANGQLMAGKPQEVDFGVKDQLGTVTVYVNFNNGGKESRKGVKAEASSIRAAIASILEESGGHLPPAQVTSMKNTYTSVSKMAFDMGCSVEYLDAKCDISASVSSGSERMYEMQSFNQAFYTVTIEPEDKDKTNFFGPGVTADILKKAAKNGPIAIIKSVTYGRSGFFKKEYKATDFAFQGSESGSYKGTTVNSKQDITKNTTASTQTGRIIGGSASTAGAALTEGDFTAEMAKNMEVSASNQGVPVTYEVQFIASGKACIQSETGKTQDINYVPLTNRASVEINGDATPLYGSKCIAFEYKYDVIEIPQTGDVANVVATNQGGREEWNNKHSTTKPIDLGPNRFIKDNELRVSTFTRATALSKWKGACHSGTVSIPSDGKLKIKLTGAYNKNDVKIKDKDGKDILK